MTWDFSDKRFEWLAEHATGWQFGESGMIAALVERIGLKPGKCMEVGAGDGISLPVTLAPLIQAGWTATLYERCEASQQRLRLEYPTARIFGEYEFCLFAGGPDVIVIDIDGDDWRVLEEVVKLTIAPKASIILCEHADTSGPQSSFLPPLKGQQATHQHLIGIAARQYQCICINIVNSLFVRRDLVDQCYG